MRVLSLFFIPFVLILSSCRIRQPIAALDVVWPTHSLARSEAAAEWHTALTDTCIAQGTRVGALQPDYRLKTTITALTCEPQLHTERGIAVADQITATIEARMIDAADTEVWHDTITRTCYAHKANEQVWHPHFSETARRELWYTCAREIYERATRALMKAEDTRAERDE